MKDNNKKDERLEELFAGYMRDEKMPSANVTQTAKEYMQKQRATEKVSVAVPAVVGDGNSAGTGSLSSFKNDKPLYIASVVLLAFAVALIVYFSIKKPDGFEFLAGLSPVSSEQLTETTSEYKNREFLSFVNASAVTECKEYVLTESTGNYNKGDTVAYYIAFNSSENVFVSVYVEVSGIYLTDLDEYKRITEEKKLNGITFYFSPSKNSYLCYFGYNNLGYNVKIDTNNRDVANGILTYIAECLN